jgi:thioester reductase-like protein
MYVYMTDFLLQIFDRVKRTRPESFNKLVPIVGDISEEKLGIKPEDVETLKDKVSK